MHLWLLLLGMIVLGIEPIVIGALLPRLSLTTILVSMGIFNCLLFLGAAFIYQTMASEDQKEQKNKVASYVFFPVFVLLTLTIDFYLVYATNMRGLVAMLAGTLLFFSVIAIGYTHIHQRGIYVGHRKMLSTDWAFWVTLTLACVVWFVLENLSWWARASVSLWSMVLILLVMIKGLWLINGNNIWKLRTFKLTTFAALFVSIIAGVTAYLPTSDQLQQIDVMDSINHYIDEFFATGNATTGEVTPQNTTTGNILTGDNTTGQIATISGAVVGTGVVATGITQTGTTSTGNSTTGTVPSDLETIETSTTTGQVSDNNTNSNLDSTQENTTDFPSGYLSYRVIIPYLVQRYTLSPSSTKKTSFTYISKFDADYGAFNTAALKRMIGKKIKPQTKVSCDTYLVLKGIAANREVSYSGSPFAPYRAKAVSLGEENGCVSGGFVTKETL